MADYKIVIPEIEDVEGIIDMHVQSWLDVYPNYEYGISREYVANRVERFTNDDGHRKRLGYIQEAHANPNYFFRIAKNYEGKVVGFIDARRVEKGNELRGLYIDKSEYGTGLAQQLSDGAMQWFGKHRDVRLTVVSYNTRAQAFYSKLGFEIVPNTEQFHNDTIIPVVEMIRKGDKL